MFDRIRNWFRSTPETEEELEAEAEGRQIRDDMETIRTGAYRPYGPSAYGDSESLQGPDR